MVENKKSELELGQKLKTMRFEQGITLQDLSEKAGVSKSLLSQIERGVSVPTVARLQKIANALDVPISDFFSENEETVNSSQKQAVITDQAHEEIVAPKVVRKGQRKKLITPWGFMMEMLCPDLQHKLEMVCLKYPVGIKVEEDYVHGGEECGVVIEGKLKGIIGDEEYTLEPGDSIYYSSSIPHRWENIGDKDALAIWAITPPSF